MKAVVSCCSSQWNWDTRRGGRNDTLNSRKAGRRVCLLEHPIVEVFLFVFLK